jgi:phosphoribosylaminoimidazole-succinocarboxamide synthase
MTHIVLSTDIPGVKRFSTGKVRDVYDLGDTVLIVTTDRISAFDSVMPNGIPDKGSVLTRLSRFWFRTLRPVVANHYITADEGYILSKLAACGATVDADLRKMLAGRSMLAVKTRIFPIECVVRGYIAGSLWQEYRQAGGPDRAVKVHGREFPAGLRESDRLPEPIFTPSTKAETGHDQNIDMDQMRRIVGDEWAEALERTSITLYKAASEWARPRGILIADTKFEFGLHAGALTLSDEALTPDSSRFWDAAAYEPGRSQPSFDKQYLRDWLVASGWNKEPPAPQLPPDVVQQTAEKYREALRRIAGDTE